MHPTGEPGEPDRRVGRRMYSSVLLLQGQWLFYSPRPSSGPAAALPMQPQPFSRLRGSGAVSPRSRSSADGAVRVPGSRPVPWRPPLPLRGLPTGAGSRQPPGGGSVRTRRRLRGGRGEGKRGGGAEPGGCLPGRGEPGQVSPSTAGAAPRSPRRGCCAGPRGSARCCWARCCWPPPGERRVSGGFVGGWGGVKAGPGGI